MRAAFPLLLSLPLLAAPVAAQSDGASASPTAALPGLSADVTDNAAVLLDRALEEGRAFAMLEELLTVAPKRLSGSEGYARAVEWGEQAMRAAGLENVRRQPVMVPRWERGAPEKAELALTDGATVTLAACALGGSIATPEEGITAPVVEYRGLAALAKAGDEVRGKIVYLSKPMNPRMRTTFAAYGDAVGQRGRGAIEAARKGAVAVVIRSMSTKRDDAPHTGAMRYADGVPKIPALALGILSAERLSEELAAGRVSSLTVAAHCRTLPDVEQWNVIGELPGASKPDEIVLVGGHLDAWETGKGAHDDGGGCVQAIEAARLLRASGLRPARTVRVVLFANEENGLRGGRAYAEEYGPAGHFFALESDSGAFAPRGIALNLPGKVLAQLSPLGEALAPVGAERLYPGGGGADISPLRQHGVRLGSLRPDDARYFDVHHSVNDDLDAVNPRELQLGAVVLAYWIKILGDVEADALR